MVGDDRSHAGGRWFRTNRRDVPGGEGEDIIDAFARLAASGFAEDAVRAEVVRLTDGQLRMLENLMRHIAGDHDA